MANKVRWSLEAAQDLESIAEYIARDSENYARLVVTKVLDSTRNFQTFPNAGRGVPEFGDPIFVKSSCIAIELFTRYWKIVY